MYNRRLSPAFTDVVELLFAAHPALVARDELVREVDDSTDVDETLAYHPHRPRPQAPGRPRHVLFGDAYRDGRRGRGHRASDSMSVPATAKAGYATSRTMQALELLAHEPLSPPNPARRIGVHERTARRLMHRLEYEGYVARERVQSPFVPTERLRSLAASLLQSQNP
jgi:hypothetical protein